MPHAGYTLLVQATDHSDTSAVNVSAVGTELDTTHLPYALIKGSSPAEKLRLFRSLFGGREDVYPRRFENRRSGKSGYAPACANEWFSKRSSQPWLIAGNAQGLPDNTAML